MSSVWAHEYLLYLGYNLTVLILLLKFVQIVPGLALWSSLSWFMCPFDILGFKHLLTFLQCKMIQAYIVHFLPQPKIHPLFQVALDPSAGVKDIRNQMQCLYFSFISWIGF